MLYLLLEAVGSCLWLWCHLKLHCLRKTDLHASPGQESEFISTISTECLQHKTMSIKHGKNIQNIFKCLTRTLEFKQWQRGSQLYTSVKSSAICAVYFALTSPSNPYIWFIVTLSWFPVDKNHCNNNQKLKLSYSKLWVCFLAFWESTLLKLE